VATWEDTSTIIEIPISLLKAYSSPPFALLHFLPLHIVTSFVFELRLPSWPASTMAIGNIYLIAAVSIIGGGLFGFDISSMSAIIGTKQYKCYFDQSGNGSCEGPKASVQGGITASMAGGSWIGALISGFVSDKLGRKKAIMLGAIIWYAFVGSVLSVLHS
jgi:MFS family permease